MKNRFLLLIAILGIGLALLSFSKFSFAGSLIDSELSIEEKVAFYGSIAFDSIVGKKRVFLSLGDVGKTGPKVGAVHIDNSENTGHALTLYSSQDSSARGSLVRLWADNSDFDKPAIWILNNGSAGSATGIRIDGPRPEIEFYETDMSSSDGKFEIRVNNDKFQIGTRKIDNSGFEYPYTFLQASDGGNFGIGVKKPKRQLHIKDTIRIEPRKFPPKSPNLGDIYVDGDSKELCFYNGSKWIGLVNENSCI
jgi:hypothetical protein